MILVTLAVEIEIEDDEDSKILANEIHKILNRTHVIRDVDVTYEEKEED